MACPVCLNPSTVPQAFPGRDVLYQVTDRTFPFRGCEECHCLFIDPIPELEELARFYPAQYWWRSSEGLLMSLEGLYRRVVLRDHVAFITAAAAGLPAECRPARLLDVGCGGATLLGLLKKRGFRVLGLDSSSEAAGIAKAQNDVDVVVRSRVHDAGFADAAFDLVTLFHVMEHVPDPREVLAEVRRILQPKGRVVLQVPNIESWQFQFCGARWYGLDVPRHVINYSSRSIGRLLTGAGFRVRRIRHFNLRDNAPALASSLFPGLDPISRHARQSRCGRRESATLAWVKHAAYAAAVAAVYPVIIAEAWAGRGGTVMLEAEKA